MDNDSYLWCVSAKCMKSVMNTNSTQHRIMRNNSNASEEFLFWL